MKALKNILSELKEIKKELQTITSSLECEEISSCWDLEHGNINFNVKCPTPNNPTLND